MEEKTEMNPEEITGRITELFPNVGIECIIDKGHAVAVVPVQLLASVFKTLNDNEALNFDMMMDLSAVDWLYRKPRFDVVYHFTPYFFPAKVIPGLKINLPSR